MIRTSHGSILALALIAIACGGSTDTDAAGMCVHEGKLYQPGESFAIDCNSCTCTGGDFACTTKGCVNGCFHDGEVHPHGSTFPAGDGCNTCSCGANGSVSCTLAACGGSGSCVYGDTTYPAGTSFPADDGCNTCFCGDDGSVACTEADCAPVCTYAGKSYTPGASFPALDGCNTCMCDENGSVGCTKIACPCDPDSEWWRKYVAKSPAECQSIKYDCPEHTTPFSNSCGCGCEQDASCPEWFDCMPPAPCDADMLKKCPFSGVAY